MPGLSTVRIDCRRIRFGLAALVVLSSFARAEVDVQAGGSCDKSPASYSDSHYHVAHVIVKSPFDYLHGVRSEILDALGSTGVKEKDEFKPSAVVRDRRRITARLQKIALGLDLPLTVDVVIAEIENCNPNEVPPTLDVVYIAFASWFPFHYASTFESRNKEESDPAQASGVSHNNFSLAPQAGYNRSERLFSGLRLRTKTPAGAFDVDGAASSSTFSVTTSNSGEHTFDSSWIQRAEWRTGYQYTDVPTEQGRLKQALLSTQFALSSRPAGSGNIFFRFGGAIDGGHQQSSLPAVTLVPHNLSNNPAGNLKVYAGVSMGSARQSLKASYALKLGETETGGPIDFAKHIGDVVYKLRLTPLDHRSLDLEGQFTAGAIQNLGTIPAVERFFGGNHEQGFLLGDSWQIRSEPFIRSIPQSRLNRLTLNAPIGGENFIATNLTLAFPVWCRPLLPAELRESPDFRPLLDGQLKSAKNTLKRYWSSKDPAVLRALDRGGPLSSEVSAMRMQFDTVSNSIPPELGDAFSDCDFQLTLAEGLVDVMTNQTMVAKRFNALSSLVAQDDDGSVDHLVGCATSLRNPLGAAFADDIVAKLGVTQKLVRDSLAGINQAVAEAKADQDMKFITRTVNTLVDELNFASISPVVAFDAARIGPQPAGAGAGMRFGLGGGLRFSLLDTVRFTAGYSINPNPAPWEGRGAAFFALDIVSLFR